MRTETMPKIGTADDVAEMLKYTKRTVYNMASRGEFLHRLICCSIYRSKIG
jgi:hypothetical protein